jgi:hypothetical protein
MVSSLKVIGFYSAYKHACTIFRILKMIGSSFAKTYMMENFIARVALGQIE